jgi:peroxiredoxin
MAELQGLQSRIDDFENAGARVVAISPDSVEQNRQVIEWLELDFPILSDAGLAATDAFGVRHDDASPEGGDIPRPATFILEGGAVRWRDLTESWRIRPRPDDLLTALRDLGS